MRTSIETKTNTTPGVEKGINPVNSTRDLLNNSLLTTIEKGEIVDKKGKDKLTIQAQTIEATKPLTNETHFMVEKQLAEMFGLGNEKVSKLREDFGVPVTLAGVLSIGENYWESANDSTYALTA